MWRRGTQQLYRSQSRLHEHGNAGALVVLDRANIILRSKVLHEDSCSLDAIHSILSDILSLDQALPSNLFISDPIIPGCGTSTAPAASNAFAFASALKSLSESKAPACPIVFPGGAVLPATIAITGFLPPLALYSLTTSAASNSASPPISPITTIPSVESSDMKARRPSASVVPTCCKIICWQAS